MKKVILFCESLHNRAGIERMTVDLANLLSTNYDVSIVVLNPFVREQSPYTINSSVKVSSLGLYFHNNLNFKIFNIDNIKKLRNHLKQEHPNVLITVATSLVRISGFAVRGLKIKHLAWEHFNLRAGSVVGSIFKLFATHMVSKTIVLTNADCVEYKKYYSPHIYVVPNFTQIGSNAPSRCENKVLLAVGRHAYQKGFDLLLKAWSKVNAPGWQLRIVGSGEDRINNEELAQELGLTDTVEFKDSTPHIAEEFQNASCFVLSSRFEGLVLVLIEAKMMGLPCVSFKCPCSPEEIIKDGEDGILVEKENINALAETLTKILSDRDKLKQLGKKGRQDALKRYSPAAVANQWIELIES